MTTTHATEIVPAAPATAASRAASPGWFRPAFLALLAAAALL